MTIDLDEARKALEILYDQNWSSLLSEKQTRAVIDLMNELEGGARLVWRESLVLDRSGFEGWEYTANALDEVAKHGNYSATLHWLALKIREQIKPSRPAEPTGLGAVVEDADGKRWIKTANDPIPWVSGGDFGLRGVAFAAITEPRILSEGVKP